MRCGRGRKTKYFFCAALSSFEILGMLAYHLILTLPRYPICYTLFVEFFARTNFRALALREMRKILRGFIFAHLQIYRF